MGIFVSRLKLRPRIVAIYLSALSGISACTSPRPTTDSPPHAIPIPTTSSTTIPPTTPDDPAQPTTLPESEKPAPAPLPGASLPSSQGLTIYAREHVASSPPFLQIKETTVGPDPPIPLEVVTRIFRRNARAALRDCYLQALAATPALTGDVMAQFLVGSDGAVRSAAVTQGLTPELDACVLVQIKQSTFPQPARGGQVTVRYPFHFLRN